MLVQIIVQYTTTTTTTTQWTLKAPRYMNYVDMTYNVVKMFLKTRI